MGIISKLREYKVGPFAIFDFVTAYGGAYLVSSYTKKYISKERLMYLVLPTAIITHIVLGIKTPLTDMVIDPKGGWIAKAVVGGSLVQAIRT